jgi:hypothetical protein
MMFNIEKKVKKNKYVRLDGTNRLLLEIERLLIKSSRKEKIQKIFGKV